MISPIQTGAGILSAYVGRCQPKSAFLSITFTCYACLSVFLLAGPPALFAAQELLLNPGFEGTFTHTAADWSLNAWGEPAVVPSPERTHALHGAASQRIEVMALPPQAGVIFRQEQIFKQGRIYRARLLVQSPTRTRVQLLLRRAGPHYDAGAIRSVMAGPEPQEIVIEGGFSTDEVPGFFGIAIREPGCVIVDEASLIDVTDEVLARPTPAGPIPATYFGIHINKLGSHNVWPDLSAGLLRLWDTATCWCHLQPASNRWDWVRADYYVQHAQRSAPAVQLLMTLGIPPNWAAPEESNPCYAGSSAAAADLGMWRTYVRSVGTRYRGRIRYWEVWNESDYAGFYTGTITQMVQMARVAWEELKAIDPQNQVLTPNITQAGLGWLDDYLTAGGGAFADIISYHSYPPATPEHAVAAYAAVQDVVRAHGLAARPIWNTEGAIEAKRPFTEEEAMGVVARTYLVQWAQGLRNFSWYCWDIHWPGGADLSQDLLRAELAPGGKAYRTVARWLIGSTLLRRRVEGTTWLLDLQEASGQRVRIAWTPQGTATITLPAEWKSWGCETLHGETSRLPHATPTIGPAPLRFYAYPTP